MKNAEDIAHFLEAREGALGVMETALNWYLKTSNGWYLEKAKALGESSQFFAEKVRELKA